MTDCVQTTVVYHFKTWVNQPVHGSGKCYAKLRNGEFRPGIRRVYHLYKSVPLYRKISAKA